MKRPKTSVDGYGLDCSVHGSIRRDRDTRRQAPTRELAAKAREKARALPAVPPLASRPEWTGPMHLEMVPGELGYSQELDGRRSPALGQPGCLLGPATPCPGKPSRCRGE